MAYKEYADEIFSYLENECEVVGDVPGAPRRLARHHLNNYAPDAPHIAAAPVVLSSQHLRNMISYTYMVPRQQIIGQTADSVGLNYIVLFVI